MSKPVDPAAPFGHKVRTGEPRKSKTGRPCLLEDALVDQIVTAISCFAPVEAACNMVGIEKETFYQWLKRGAREKRKGRNTKYTRFSDSVKRAMGNVEVGIVAGILEAGRGRAGKVDGKGNVTAWLTAPQWQALAWLLERRKPKRYARRTYRIEDGPIAAGGGDGVVETYRVFLPAVDPEPGQVAPPHPEAAIAEPGPESVKGGA